MTKPPAQIGDPIQDILTPALVVDLDSFEANLRKMASFASEAGIRLRPHAKTHKSADIALMQIAQGAVGVCCQKLSEAEALVAGGVPDVMISNQVVGIARLTRLAELAGKARLVVCVDDASATEALSAACQAVGSQIDVVVEIDVGQNRCGVAPGAPALELGRLVARLPNLRFAGVQAYHGSAQHYRSFAARRKAIDAVTEKTRSTVNLLAANGLACEVVGGAGTGTYAFEGTGGVYSEIQPGSYLFMDADYGRNLSEDGGAYAPFQNSLFVLATIMSKTQAGQAVSDAGHKSYALDSGMPLVRGCSDLEMVSCSDEHGVIRDPEDLLSLEDRVWLIPGHCDPTVNLHDWFVGVRGDRVETLWPVTARGCLV
ncbi:MAG: DSD1 family PLP-dependent enzyme [Pseudomonadota bacterium]